MRRASHGHIREHALRKWLFRGQVSRIDPAQDCFDAVLREIGQPVNDFAHAALRFWGQTGERSGAWIAAADLVHLEAGSDYLRLHALDANEITPAEQRHIFDYLQATFGTDTVAFAKIGHYAYVRGDASMAMLTARLSAKQVDGEIPDEYMPQGLDARSHDSLLSEIQMALHDHEINQLRAQNGQFAINSVWFWGGGFAPAQETIPMPLLFSNDPVFRGFWLSRAGIAEPWFDEFAAQAEQAVDAFVSVVPARSAGEMIDPEQTLRQLRRLLRSGKIRSLILIFGDGLRVEISDSDRFRIWRRESRGLSLL